MPTAPRSWTASATPRSTPSARGSIPRASPTPGRPTRSPPGPAATSRSDLSDEVAPVEPGGGADDAGVPAADLVGARERREILVAGEAAGALPAVGELPPRRNVADQHGGRVVLLG